MVSGLSADLWFTSPQPFRSDRPAAPRARARRRLRRVEVGLPAGPLDACLGGREIVS